MAQCSAANSSAAFPAKQRPELTPTRGTRIKASAVVAATALRAGAAVRIGSEPGDDAVQPVDAGCEREHEAEIGEVHRAVVEPHTPDGHRKRRARLAPGRGRGQRARESG